MRSGLQIGDFLDEVMSHLQGLSDAEANLSVEVLVKGPDRIDYAIARIVPDNARSHKVDNPPIYLACIYAQLSPCITLKARKGFQSWIDSLSRAL